MPRAMAATWPATTTNWCTTVCCRPSLPTIRRNSSKNTASKEAVFTWVARVLVQAEEAHRVDIPLARRLMADDLVAAAEAQSARQIDGFRFDIQILFGIEEHVDLGRQQISFVRFYDHAQPARFQHDHGTNGVD